MTTQVVPKGDRTLQPATPPQLGAIEAALSTGDLSKLTSEQRTAHYVQTCERLGLNPYTSPFGYIFLKGQDGEKKLTLYAKRDCADQLRKLHRISVTVTREEVQEGVLYVYVKAEMPDGREDTDVGAVPVAATKVVGGKVETVPLPPLELANARMKCYTKAKRRVTLSICGLGILDESELDGIPPYRRQEQPKMEAEVRRVLRKPPELEADDLEEPVNEETERGISENQYQRLVAITTRYGITLQAVQDFLGAESLRGISVRQYKTYLRTLVAAHEHEQ